MAGQGFDPHFSFSWPTARIGVMEGDSAVQAIYGADLDKFKKEDKPVPEDLQRRIDQTRADYDRWLQATYAAARGQCDAVIDPVDTRKVLGMAFDVACSNPRPEHLTLELLQS